MIKIENPTNQAFSEKLWCRVSVNQETFHNVTSLDGETRMAMMINDLLASGKFKQDGCWMLACVWINIIPRRLLCGFASTR
ncbi:hypothetical protein CEXT_303311 [Caerostris extrusa]|uniref:Uncharacterized protein n=1 Tax=Caerostris extrusa TaxID=172846 RepID=A0AAV4P6W1_CAEEX|nr:hypothetical protein CEXT_303311 [Caerostris extrusa]